MAERHAEVVIIGGGAIGCAVAWSLARRGIDVLLFERGSPAREATWAAGGMLSPLAEAEEHGPFLDLALASFRRFPTFVAELEAAAGMDVEYRTTGKLELALDDDAAERLRERAEWQRTAGFEVELLDGHEVRALEAAVSPAAVAGLRIVPDQRVDNRAFGRALWLAAARAGARVRVREPVARILTDTVAGRVEGVELATGERVSGDHVIVAAGSWSGRLGGLPRALPVSPVRGQMAALEAVPPPVDHVLAGDGCYLIPRSTGRVIVGSTTERVGFRPRTTASGIARLLAVAERMVPSLGNAAVADLWAGLRPGTPDGLPILGPDPEVDGLSYATGHYRNGILLTPITAALIGAHVTDGELPLALEPFLVDRTMAAAG